MIVRVYEQDDGHIIISSFNMEYKRPDETENDYRDRISKKFQHGNLPFTEIDNSKIPKDRSERNKWRLVNGNIVVDKTLETLAEVKGREELIADTELKKVNPDIIKVVKAQRNIEKLNKENWFSRKKTQLLGKKV